jgi:1-acyl-sn-glycerol-3-phosphate acyltransferase
VPGLLGEEASLRLSPAWCLRQPLASMRDGATRALLRGVLSASLGGIRVEGARRLAEIEDPAIFAFTHHNAYEALLAPAALIALRNGRAVRFLVDWMYLELPLAGALIRRGEAIPVYRKAARWRWRERVRLQGLRGTSSADRALAALSLGTSVGVYPEGRRNADPWRLAPIRQGAAVLALRSGAPLVPIGIDFPARHRLGRIPRLGRMVLRIGEPLAPAALQGGAGEIELLGAAPLRPSEFASAAALSRQLQTALAQLARKSTLP